MLIKIGLEEEVKEVNQVNQVNKEEDTPSKIDLSSFIRFDAVERTRDNT